MTTENNSTEVLVEDQNENKISKYVFFVFDMFLITAVGGRAFLELFDVVYNKLFGGYSTLFELLLLLCLACALNPLFVWFAYSDLAQANKKNKKKKSILFAYYIY